MRNSVIEEAEREIGGIVALGDALGLRELLDRVYDAGADDLVRNLVTVEYAAARWAVSERRARAHIAALNAKHGIGWQIGGAWVMRREDIDQHAPQSKYRRKEG